MKAHLFTDADNTLWDTDTVFAAAQLEMLREVEKLTGRTAPEDEDQGLAFLRTIDQRIATEHPDHLRYPPALLAQGLALVLEGERVEGAVARVTAPNLAPTNAFEPAQSRFLDAIRRLPPLRKGVREGLLAVTRARIPVMIVTEERAERCRKFATEHQLDGLIDEIISVRKTHEAYANLKRKAGPGRCFMVGDQMDRDIVVAVAAGFSTFYFPGGFAPYWASELDSSETTRIDRFDAIVPEILAAARIRHST
ncbi:putative hydrolase of the HAD superfamily [Bradyrhizobium sp. S3.2.6]|uniref:HAD family hydrolase n=1 Tax=Bradyrhizobium sp. S3.2.6 TaxID=3156428 RepID=UPI0033915DDF